MKTKIFSLLFALIASVGTIVASNTQVDGIWYDFDTSTLRAIVTYRGANAFSYSNEYVGSVVIPSSVTYNSETYVVTSIGKQAFAYNSQLTSVAIPNSVTSIGDAAFSQCSGLTSVAIPDGITNIGNNVFNKCTGLTSVTIPYNVTHIENSAFQDCSNVTSVIWNAKNSNASNFGSQVESFVFGNSVEVIPASLCSRMYKLSSIIIPNSVTRIESEAFRDCSGLTSIDIPNNVISIGERAFSGCSNMPIIDNIRYADTYLIEVVDKSLTSYTIKEGTMWIGASAFSSCYALTSIEIPSSVISIEKGTFGGCYSLTNIVVEAGNTTYDSRDNCNAIIETASNTLIFGCNTSIIPAGVAGISEKAFYAYTGLTNIEIPNSVISIDKEAFYGCSGLTSVNIPNSVTSIGNNAFYFIPNIVYHGNATGSPWGARSINGYVDGWLVYSDETKKNILACSAAAEGDINLPNSVTSIGDYAFYGCRNLTSVTMSGNVTYIGSNAFVNCYSLTAITIPNSVRSIGEGTFGGCSGLISIDIPNSVTSIGNNAFSMVPNIVYHGNATGSPWGARSINGYVDGWLVYSDETKTNILACSAAAEGDISLPNRVITIGNNAFYKCKSLTSVNIPNSVTTIGDRAFYGCYKLTSIPLHDNITHIGGWVFYDSGLQTPNYNSHIFAFIPRGQTGSYSIPEGITTIADGVFDQCQLSSLTIPSSVMNMRKIGGPCQIRRIICKVVTPPQVDALLYSNSVLSVLGMEVFVPDESVQAYKNADVWKLCNIYPLSELPQSIENTCIHDESHKILRDGQILILRGDKTYTLTGQEIR